MHTLIFHKLYWSAGCNHVAVAAESLLLADLLVFSLLAQDEAWSPAGEMFWGCSSLANSLLDEIYYGFSSLHCNFIYL